MTLLAKYIESLLLEHSEVAVPALGTFVVTYKPLSCQDDGMFYIPSRDISLVPTDQQDEGILVSFVADRERCSIDRASDMVAGWVEECQLAVQENGYCDLGAIGQLVLEQGEVMFQPCRAGLPCPDFFGLDNLEMPLLPILTSQIKAVVESQEQMQAGQQVVEDKRGRHIVIRLNRSLVHYVASVAAAILLFFVISTPTSNVAGKHEAALTGFFLPASEPSEAGDAEMELVEDIEADVQQEEAPVRPAVVDSRFAIVVASSIRQNNAEAMVNRLQSRGIEGAQVFVHNGMVRVAFLGYNSREEAATAAANMRTRDKELEGAWVFEIK